MEPFRSVRGGGVRVWLAAAEASLLRNLVGQVMDLITVQDVAPSTDPGSPRHRDPDITAPDDLAHLEAMLHEPGSATPPEDPVLARLLPDAYRDDPDAAGEFRRFTEPALRSAKQEAAQQMLDSLPDAGGRIQLTGDQAMAWLKALNDVRLALGTKLGVTEEFEQEWARLKPDDRRWSAYEVYAWLGAVQESLVQALH